MLELSKPDAQERGESELSAGQMTVARLISVLQRCSGEDPVFFSDGETSRALIRVSRFVPVPGDGIPIVIIGPSSKISISE